MRVLFTTMLTALLLVSLASVAGVPLKEQSVTQLEQRLEAIDAELDGLARYSLRNGAGAIGYRSRDYPLAEDPAWVEIRFDGDTPLDELMLVPALWRDSTSEFRSDGFPETFRILTGTTDDPDGRIIAEITADDAILPRIAPLVIPTPGVTASWVRIESTRMTPRAFDGKYVFQFSEILVFSGPENVALHKLITTSPNEWDGAQAWDPSYATDGFVPYLMNSGQGSQSTAYLSPIVHLNPQRSAPKRALTLDLQQALPLSRIHLHVVDQGDTIPQEAPDGIGLPRHFLVEGAIRPDFSDRIVLLDVHCETLYDTAPIMMWNIPITTCRYVRVTALEPYIYEKGTMVGPRIGFAEIAIFSEGVNVARDKPVSTSFATEIDRSRPISALTDGSNLYGTILPIRDWLNQLAQRHDLEIERPLIAEELTRRYVRQKVNLRRMGWLAGLLTAGIGFTILIDQLIRTRQVARLKQRFAADLHDELGANLHTIGLLSDLAEEVQDDQNELSLLHQRIRAVTERTGMAVRNCTNLLEAKGLYTGLVSDMRRASERIMTSLDHDIQIDGEEHLSKLSRRSSIDLFLFYKETLVNISRHAGATRFSTHLTATPKTIHLTVSDNGRGITDGIPAALKRRAKLLGAKIAVTRPETGGTEISLRLRIRTGLRT